MKKLVKKIVTFVINLFRNNKNFYTMSDITPQNEGTQVQQPPTVAEKIASIVAESDKIKTASATIDVEKSNIATETEKIKTANATIATANATVTAAEATITAEQAKIDASFAKITEIVNG